MLDRYFRSFENPGALLAVVTTVLLSLGVVMLYSASGARAGLEENRMAEDAGTTVQEEFKPHHGAGYFARQLIWTGIGLAMGLGLLYVSIERLERYALPLFIVGIVSLLAVSFTPLGLEVNGAQRWIALGPFTLQPAEFGKIGLVIFTAKFLADKREEIQNLWKGFLPSVGALGLFCALIMLQKDLGTIVLSGTVVVGLWCLAQVRLRHLATLVLLAIPAVVYLVLQHSYRIRRILAFLYPEQYADAEGYQLTQSLIAVGSSGIFGPGLGQGLQKYHYLVEGHTDFVFAIVAEELGLVGALAVCLLFMTYVVLGLVISYRAPDYFSGLMAAGLTMLIGCSAFLNFFVVLGMAPTKGLALPFFSYGGSSLLASLVCTALLINVANYTQQWRGSQEVV